MSSSSSNLLRRRGHHYLETVVESGGPIITENNNEARNKRRLSRRSFRHHCRSVMNEGVLLAVSVVLFLLTASILHSSTTSRRSMRLAVHPERTSTLVIAFPTTPLPVSQRRKGVGPTTIAPLPSSPSSSEDDSSSAEQGPDYGGLEIEIKEGLTRPRTILAVEDDTALYEEGIEASLEEMDVAKHGLKQHYLNDEDFTGEEQCQRNNWRSKHFPLCNTFHENTLHRAYDDGDDGDNFLQSYNVTFRGHGTFRYSWILQRSNNGDSKSSSSSTEDSFVWKTMRYNSPFDYRYAYQMHNEAIIMERFTSSPRIVDIYGFCATSILAENMVKEVTPDIIVGYDIHPRRAGFIKQEELDMIQQEDGDVHPMNNLTVEEKLDYAIVMAESIADIHGFEGGVIVHGDIYPEQWLRSASGLVKLNDFNNAEIFDYDRENERYCDAYRCYAGTFRAPEELECEDADEGVDTYAIGNNIYTLLTGLWPYYQYGNNHFDKSVQQKIADREEKPFVDDRYRNRSKIESGLVQIMEQCWEFDRHERVSIFEVVKQLKMLKNNNSHQA